MSRVRSGAESVIGKSDAQLGRVTGTLVGFLLLFRSSWLSLDRLYSRLLFATFVFYKRRPGGDFPAAAETP